MVGAYLSGIFASSPIGPLQQHMEKVVVCVAELVPFTEAVIKNDPAERHAAYERIVSFENDADVLKKDLRLHLPTSLFMPIDRRDMLQILTMQDKVAGVARDISGIIDGRGMKLPDAICAGYLELVKTCLVACEQAQQAIGELDELIETSFDKSERQRISNTLAELDATEHLTDKQVSNLYQTLMDLEAEHDPIYIMFMYKILDLTADIADRAQRVGSRLQLTLAR
jgi:predicted phosphate transport protein (TIGR00153 family)